MPEIAPPPKSAPFQEKMAYYRSQHTSRGVRATHLVGIPTVAFSLPLVFGRPKVGVPVFIGGWALQVLGHKVFEKNSPALKNGFFSYQLCGLAFWCEEMVEILAKVATKVDGRAAGDPGGAPHSTPDRFGARPQAVPRS
ncbi:DUF962 domain-containing protein [Carbonactinospora thermoautotrophica]|uniref:DUF962 domain-containing protein n=1 Tax=Carbonactinospora thermoautotrophica TaxID=1469144 RepID=UPI002270C6BF|nr:DUF962 domain-containing protein [Carbonactinospora thermoautotrophica]